jgi:hypothetical protein
MKTNYKWFKVLALSIGLPSTILGLFLLIQSLINSNYISKTSGTIAGIAIVSVIILQIVIFAFNAKNNP